MPIHNNRTDQAIASITECLDVVASLVEKRPDGSIIGYVATILLFIVTDAIGHGLNYGSGDTRLEVLRHPFFGLNLSNQKLLRIKQWYRNPLLHNASIVPDVVLSAEDEGCAFGDVGENVLIRVPQFYKMVRSAWDSVDKQTFDPVRDAMAITGYITPRPLSDPQALLGTTAQAAVASGNVSLPTTTATQAFSGTFTVVPTALRAPELPMQSKKRNERRGRKG